MSTAGKGIPKEILDLVNGGRASEETNMDVLEGYVHFVKNPGSRNLRSYDNLKAKGLKAFYLAALTKLAERVPEDEGMDLDLLKHKNCWEEYLFQNAYAYYCWEKNIDSSADEDLQINYEELGKIAAEEFFRLVERFREMDLRVLETRHIYEEAKAALEGELPELYEKVMEPLF